MIGFEPVERNLRESMQCYARGAAYGEIREVPGVLIANAGCGSPVFNAALLVEPVGAEPAELDRRIMIAKVFFEARGLRWCFWVCEDLVDPSLRRQAKALFQSRRLAVCSDCPGMVADRIVPPTRPLPVLECRLVTDATTRSDFCGITSRAFRLPLVNTNEIYGREQLWGTGFVGHVGYLEGVPVATAATVAVDGAVGLYSVATLEEFRGRGFAERMVRHALERAKSATGIERSVLESSALGHAMYVRLGYREVTKFFVYISQ